MATYRIGIGSFNLKDGAVGIGTESTGLGNLKVEGTYKVTDLDVTGVSTFTRYAGFAPDNLGIDKDTTLTGEHLTTGDIVVGVNSTFTVSVGATVDVGTVPSVSIGTHFSPPTGDINDRPEVPVEGTVRYNRDLNTLEFYNGVDWRQFTVSGTSGRAVIAHGYRYPYYPDHYDLINIQTTGNATYFGDFAYTGVRDKCGCGSQTRGLFGGGITAGSSRRTEIDMITIQSEGNALDFGDLIGSTGAHNASCSSQTRGIWHGGYGASPSPAPVNLMDYVEIQTLGNALDFGDLFQGTGYNSSFSGPTRGFNSGGHLPPAATDYVQMFTIATKGNAIDFGTLTAIRSRPQALANTIMGFTSGGAEGGDRSIDRTIIASGGQAIVFGDSPSTRASGAGTNTQTRGIFAGGGIGAAPGTTTDEIEYFNLQSGGTVADFGNLTEASYFVNGTSDSHGGLGGY